jgi:hypothetical protein
MAYSEDEVQITLERIRDMPRGIRLNLGAQGAFTRDELIDAINSRSEIGELVVRMQMAYVRSFKERVNE